MGEETARGILDAVSVLLELIPEPELVLDDDIDCHFKFSQIKSRDGGAVTIRIGIMRISITDQLTC